MDGHFGCDGDQNIWTRIGKISEHGKNCQYKPNEKYMNIQISNDNEQTTWIIKLLISVSVIIILCFYASYQFCASQSNTKYDEYTSLISNVEDIGDTENKAVFDEKIYGTFSENDVVTSFF